MSTLSNFYTDNASEINIFEIFLDAEKQLFDLMTDYTNQIKSNFSIGEMETYRIIDTQTISIAPATYDLSTLLTMDAVVNYLGMASNTLLERIENWNALEANDASKISALNIAGYCVAFSASTVTISDSFPPLMDFTLVSMDLYYGEKKFQIGVDFDIKNNKLYLLSEDCYHMSNAGKAFTLRNIAVDFNTTQRYIGKNFNITQYEDFSKDIFNDILSNLVKAALKGPSIAGMKAGIDTITGVEGSGNIYDMFSLDTKRRSMWDDYNLTPFDFIIELPAEYSDSESLSDLIKKFVDVVKLPETNYDILFTSLNSETYNRHVLADDSDYYLSTAVTYTEDYKYRTVIAQTNVLDYMLNSNFVTEDVNGYLVYETGEITILDTSTGNSTIVIF